MPVLMIVLSVVLLVLTPISYVPQYRSIMSAHSCEGTSLWATFLVTLVFQAQIANMYYLFRSSHEMEEGVPIATPPTICDWINLSQIIVQWLCSLVSYILVLSLAGGTVFNETSTSDVPAPHQGSITLKRAMTTGLVMHVALVAMSIPLTTTPTDVTFNIVRAFNCAIVQPVLVVVLVASYLIQAFKASQRRDLGSLNTQTISFHIILFLALALLWPSRLILPRNLWTSPQFDPALIAEWYPWVGWACINSALNAIGSAYVLYCTRRSNGAIEQAGDSAERQSLLAN